MNVYRYDELTKEYIGYEEALLDPLETEQQGENIYLLPANATFTAPTESQDGYVNVWNGTAWEQVEDNRGVEYWLPEDTYGAPAREMKELGALPEGATLTPPEQTLQEAKADKHREAGALFAKKRDAIRQIAISDGNTYGFDCANEDITNFMASWKAAEVSGSTPYKVWIADGGKGLITMQLVDFDTVFKAVRDSQLEAYAWYGTVDAKIQACETKEELAEIVLN
mgnify:FL=1